MRTNIDLDEDLLREAMKLSKISTKKEVVNAGLQEIINLHRVASLKELQGKVKWVGNLEKMRTYDKWHRD